MTISNATHQALIAAQVSKADTPLKRMRGLLGRAHLLPSEALIIVPCQSVHMLFMKFPIDVLFLDKDQRVVGTCIRLLPFQFSPVFWKSTCAIELPVGTIEKTNTRLGDQIHISE